jgi:hypothetical protein
LTVNPTLVNGGYSVTIAEGGSLWALAGEQYGDEKFWP